MPKMKKTNIRYCKTCIYSATQSATNTTTCDYYLITGERRNCGVGECDKHETRNKKRRHKFTVKKGRSI